MLGVGLPSIVAAPLVHHLLCSRPPVCPPPFAQAALLAWPPPLRPPFVARTVCPALSRPSPCPAPPRLALPFVRMPGAQEGQCATPLLSVRGQQSPLPRLHPALPARPPPPLHTCWGQGGQSVPPPFPFTRKRLRPGCSPSPGLCATRRACACSPTLCANVGRGAGGAVRTSPFRSPLRPGFAIPAPRFTTRLTSPARLPLCTHAGEAQGTVPPPLSCVGSPLHPGCAPPPCLTPPARPPPLLRAYRKRRRDGCAHNGKATQRGPHVRGGPHARGPRAKGPRVRGGLHARGPCAKGRGTERWAVQPGKQTAEARRVCEQGEAQPRRRVLRASGGGVRK